MGFPMYWPPELEAWFEELEAEMEAEDEARLAMQQSFDGDQHERGRFVGTCWTCRELRYCGEVKRDEGRVTVCRFCDSIVDEGPARGM